MLRFIEQWDQVGMADGFTLDDLRSFSRPHEPGERFDSEAGWRIICVGTYRFVVTDLPETTVHAVLVEQELGSDNARAWVRRLDQIDWSWIRITCDPQQRVVRYVHSVHAAWEDAVEVVLAYARNEVC